jgi:signal transduction histidine kinase
MKTFHTSRFIAVIPTIVLAGVLMLSAVPHRDLAKERAFAEGAARQDAEQTLRREAGQAARYLSVQQAVALSVLKQRLAEHVDSGYAVMGSIYRAGKDVLPEDKLKAMVRDSLRDARFFEGRGYFFIDGMDGEVVLMPLHPAREGDMLLDNRDDQGTYIMRGLIDTAAQVGGKGYFTYRWFSPQDKNTMDEKVAYVRYFAPYDWLVGAGEYVPAVEQDIVAEAVTRMDAVRFGATGGIGLSSSDGSVALFPEARSAAGEELTGGVDVSEGATQALWQKISVVAAEGGGFITYSWPNPNSGRWEERGAWVESVTANGRVIYASAHISDFLPPQQGEVPEPFLTRLRALSVALLAVAASLLIAWMMPGRHETRL